MLFIIVCLLFCSSRSLLNVSCIFSILFPRFWIIFTMLIWILFQVTAYFLFICLVCLVLALLLHVLCFSLFSFCLTYCVWGLLFSGCRFVVPVVFGACPQCLRLVQWVVQASWWSGLVPMFSWMRLDLVFLVGRSTSGCVFWGVCELIMILGNLSTNGWGCVPVLLVVWQRLPSIIACWSLSGAGS